MAPCCWHEDQTCDRGRTVSQSGRIRVVQPGGMDEDSCAPTAACRSQAQVEEAVTERQGSAFLVVALKGLERLHLGARPREARDRAPME